MPTLLKTLLLPPVGLLVVALLGLLAPTERRGPRRLARACLGLLLLVSLPAVSDRLLHGLDWYPPLPPDRVATAGAIVILSAEAVPGQGTEPAQPGPLSLTRLRQGAALARASGLPILVTGGRVEGLADGDSLAAVMRRSLEQDFRVEVAWSETAARNTHQNAALSAPLLRAAGIDTIVLVSQSWHLPRAVREFERQGLTVLPAPVGGGPPPPLTRWQGWLPSVKAWQTVFFAGHEAAGLVRLHLWPEP